jgi:hypothetical protein
MEGKRPFGLTAFLILKMLFGAAVLCLASFMYLDVLQNSGLRIPWLEKIRLALFPAYVIFYLVTCVSLFKLKKWARWVSVILDASIILYLLPAPIRDIRNFFRYGAAPLAVWEALWPFTLDLFLLALLFWFIYYLTRPQAGRQFR